jgi:hypothetical protein
MKSRIRVKDWAVCSEGKNQWYYADHLTCPVIRGDRRPKDSWLVTEKPLCWYCHVPVPDEVQALMILSNNAI